MVSMRNMGLNRQWCYLWGSRKRMIVEMGNRLPTFDPTSQFTKLADPQRTLKIGQPIVVAQFHHLVEPGTLLLSLPVICGDAVVAEGAHALRQCGIVGCDHAPFARGDLFHRVQAEGAHGGQAANGAPFVLPTQGVTGVRNEGQVVGLRDGIQGIVVAWMPRVIYSDDCSGFCRNFGLHLRGIKQTSWLVNFFTIGKLLPLIVFALVGVWFADWSRVVPSGPAPLTQLGQAALLLIFAYGGYEVTGIPAGEASNPKKDVPFAFVAVILIVSAVMTLTAAVATGLLPDVGATTTPIADASALIMGAFGGLLVSLGSVISTTGNNMGQLLSGSRTVYALAENGDLPPVFAKVHPEFRTPYVAIWFTSIVLVVLALTGSFVFLAAVSAVARLVVYLSACGATLRLRRADRASRVAPAQFTAPLGPVIPLLAIAITSSILAGATSQQLLSGVVALAVGAVLFAIATRGVQPAA